MAAQFPVTRLVRAASLRVSTKIAVGLSLLLVGVCISIFLYFPQRIRDAALEGLGNEARALSGVAAHTLAAPIVFDDTSAVRDVLANLRSNPVVAWVSVENLEGRAIAQSGSLEDSTALRTNAGLTPDGSLHMHVGKITHDAVEVGTIRLALSTAGPRREANRQRVHILLFSLLVCAIVMLGTSVVARATLTPLTHVAEAARAIANGDINTRAAVETGDEIGSLASSFNTMVDQLMAAQGNLELANEKLEQRVRDRTQRLAEEIEERRRAEHELKISEERFRSLFERAPIGIALVDMNGKIFEFNEPLQRLLGYESGELRGRHVRDIITSEDIDHSALPDALLYRDINAEAVCMGKSRNIDARVALSAVSGEAGNIHFVSMMVLDLSAEKELEAKFRQAQKLEAVGRLAGGIAHDFNNLLTTINGFSDLVMQEMAADDPRRVDVEEVRKSGERAALLTRQLLAFSRQQVLQPRVLDLSAVVTETARMLKRLIGDNIDLRIRAKEGLPCVKVDPSQIVQVLLNLAVNARDAMEHGGVLEITTGKEFLSRGDARALETQSQGEYVTLTVRDTGCGIDPRVLAHIFEPFFTTKDVGKGTGLGLATVYGIVKQSGGAITVKSEVGRGTSFTIYFPANDRAAAITEPTVQPSGRGNETVLIAEDEPTVRRFVSRVLKRAGYRVLESADGAEALELVNREPGEIHLLLTDAVMPRMSGAELMVQLHRQRPGIKVLFMSGYTRDTMKEQGVDVGEMAFLQKPVSPAVLANSVRSLLDGVQLETTAPPAHV